MAKLKKDEPPKSFKERYDLTTIIVAVVFITCLIGSIIFLGYQAVSVGKELKQKEQAQQELFDRKIPDYETMEAIATAQEKTTVTEGTLGLEEFEKQLVIDNTSFFDSIRDIIGDKLYVGFIGGFGTNYFHNSAIYNYEDLNTQIDEMLIEAGLINALYNRYILDQADLTEISGCTSGEECDMLKFINKYTSGELKEFLSLAHTQWESLVYYEMSKQEIDESYIDLFYQDEICDSLEYIDKFDVSFIVLNNEQFMMEPIELQKAYESELVPVTRVCNYGDVEGAIPARTALSTVQLYKDIDFYDGEFATLASNTIQTLFLKNEIDGMQYLGGGELASDSNALKEEIKKVASEAPKEDEINSLGDLDYSQLQNWNIQELSLCDRNEEDVMYVLWKINRIEHTTEIPTVDELRAKLENKAKVYQAQKKLSTAVYTEKQGMTDEEIEEFLSQVYTGHTEQ